MNDAILFAVRHSLWANEKLLGYCAGLSREQLVDRAWNVRHGRGDLAPHRLRGPGVSLGSDGQASRRANAEAPGPLEDLLPKIRAIREACEQLLAAPFDVDRVIERPRTTATAGVVIAQLVHHGSDHRAHVGTILGAHGLDANAWDLDLWEYGKELGIVKRSDT